MKKLARCAVLLAFALAFAGCSNDGSKSSGGAKNLQAALNAGGDVNLDDYTVSSGKTYTVSKTTTITGDAKGAKFTIGDGADVTFNGTKGLGTLLVGSSASPAKSALPARATETTSPKITLKGGVTVGYVFVYVACTLNAEGSDGTFINVVIAESVASVTLGGTAKVTNLVALGEGEITIIVDNGVKITKANGKAKEAVTKSNSIVDGDIDDIDDDDLGDLEDAFENVSKGDGKIISTKEDLAEAVKGIIKAYYDFAQEVDDKQPNSRAVATATTKNDVAAQLKKVFDDIYGAYTDDVLRDSIINLFIGEGANKDINLNAEINLANVKPSIGMEAFIDLVNHGNGEMDEGKTNYTLQTYFGDDYPTVKDFLDVADKYATLSNLYALGKLNVNVNNPSNYASAEAKFNLAVDVDDINGMIPELFKAYNNNIHHTYVPTSANLPVTAVKPFIDLDVKADLSKAEYEDLVKVLKNLPGDGDEPEWDFDVPHPTYPDSSDYYGEDGCFDESAWDRAHEEYQQAYAEYWKKFYEYEERYDAEWDEYMAKHREEVKKYFLNVKYPGSYSGKISAGVSTTVTSSANIPGGIITLSLDASYSSPAKILALLAEGLDDVDDYKAFLRKLKDEYGITPTVTVTDYDRNQTLKLGLDDIIYVIDEVVKDIGGIIQ